MISTSIYRTIEQNAIADGKKCEMKGGYFKDTSLTVGAVKYFLQVLIVSQRLNYHWKMSSIFFCASFTIFGYSVIFW